MFGPKNLLFTVLELVTFGGILCTAGDVYGRFSEWQKISPINNLKYFLWIFGAWTWGIFVMVLVVWKKTYTDMKDSDRETVAAKEELAKVTAQAKDDLAKVNEELENTRKLAASSAKLQHHMAEEVRKCAKAGTDFDHAHDLQQIFRQLQDYLRDCFGIAQAHVTVKIFDGGKLIAAFRDDGQDRGPGGDPTDLSDSYAYRSFKERDTPEQWALARDIQLLPAIESTYKERAKKLHFRSVVAFPLRHPAIKCDFVGGTASSLKCANLFGFLSLDADDPNAFDALFRGPPDKREWSNDGANLTLGIDSELYYGIADSVATVLMLSKKLSISRTEKADG
jgi:hypothetical protein